MEETMLVCIFCGAWPFLAWHIFQSPVNRATWIGWVVLWCLFAPLLGLKTAYNGWRALMGDVWIIDARRDRIERNGTVLGALSQMAAVRVWQQSCYEDGLRSVLAIVPQNGKPIVLCDYGNVAENWEELSEIARRIAYHAQLPVESSGN